MKIFTSQRGYSLILVLGILVLLSTLFHLSYVRTMSTMTLIKNRYWEGITLDLAVNGVEFERMMISNGKINNSNSFHRKEIGMFAGYAGLFEARTKKMSKHEFEIASTGILVDREGSLKLSLRIITRIKQVAKGRWETVYWDEKRTDLI